MSVHGLFKTFSLRHSPLRRNLSKENGSSVTSILLTYLNLSLRLCIDVHTLCFVCTFTCGDCKCMLCVTRVIPFYKEIRRFVRALVLFHLPFCLFVCLSVCLSGGGG